jgi:hypothetical protein
MNEETPHELVISGPGGLTREETLNAAAQLFPLTRAGQHVYFDVPETRGTGPVYAFAKSQGLKVLDINRVGGRLRVKCVDTP